MARAWSEAWEGWLTSARGAARRGDATCLAEGRGLLQGLPGSVPVEVHDALTRAIVAWVNDKPDEAATLAVEALAGRVSEPRVTLAAGQLVARSERRTDDAVAWLERAQASLAGSPLGPGERQRELAVIRRALAVAFVGGGQAARAFALLKVVPRPESGSPQAAWDTGLRARVAGLVGVPEEQIAPREASGGTASLRSQSVSVAAVHRALEQPAELDLRAAAPGLEGVLSRVLAVAVSPGMVLLQPLRAAVAARTRGRPAYGLVLVLAVLGMYAGASTAIVLTPTLASVAPWLALASLGFLPGVFAANALVLGEWISGAHRPRYSVRTLWLGPLVHGLIVLLLVASWGAFADASGMSGERFRASVPGLVTIALFDVLMVCGVAVLWIGRLETFDRRRS